MFAVKRIKKKQAWEDLGHLLILIYLFIFSFFQDAECKVVFSLWSRCGVGALVSLMVRREYSQSERADLF